MIARDLLAIQGARQVPCQNGKSISCDDVAGGGTDSGDGGSVGDDATTTVEGGGGRASRSHR